MISKKRIQGQCLQSSLENKDNSHQNIKNSNIESKMPAIWVEIFSILYNIKQHRYLEKYSLEREKKHRSFLPVTQNRFLKGNEVQTF